MQCDILQFHTVSLFHSIHYLKGHYNDKNDLGGEFMANLCYILHYKNVIFEKLTVYTVFLFQQQQQQ